MPYYGHTTVCEFMLTGFVHNYQKQPQFNTVIVQQKEMDRVGVEPTTSEHDDIALYLLLREITTF
jgi:hypothetical protein